MVGQPPEALLSLLFFVNVGDRANPFPNRAVIGLQRHSTSHNPAVLTSLGQNAIGHLAGLALLENFLPDRNDPLPVIRMKGIQPAMAFIPLGRLRREFLPAPAFED